MGLLESLPPDMRVQVNQIWASPRKRAISSAIIIMTVLLSILGILGYIPTIPLLPVNDYRLDEGATRSSSWKVKSDFDIVVSHYNEDVGMMKDSINGVLHRLPRRKSRRVIIYCKGPPNETSLKALSDISDEVVQLENVGREGETYLSHIVRHYETPFTNLAGHTIFMQPHLAWHWLFLPRLERDLDQNTGFLSFGPYISHICGKDSHDQHNPRMADIYSMFRMDLCPPDSILGTWAGQFVVSRQRILENPLRAYENLRNKFHEPKEHWIYKEGWWNNEPSNPTLGHALERSWPMIFNCTDPTKVETCKEEGPTGLCQCSDKY
ncbi:uncharacterized protein L201_005265 [Kwoniella dendrophila CBS 6074]|uniref:Uncharacterized protein n=1 Tax=Kwoniella dendrophila CBS 6074 TaxID=1295534 RepID=A0AAX4JY96_9TREE